ncbi:MAG: radical SAM protein [Oligoflexia bacterium]|nr:radical SAM protein [Oligoflexia bacterium]
MSEVLDVLKHDRANAGLKYVYPVVSRRAGGVSVGINLNTNDACNWRCIYCQVPELQRGSAPPVDLALLESELRGFLREESLRAFLQARVPEPLRRLNDIAFSGNGEATTSPEFPEAVEIVIRVLRELGVDPAVKLVLITNGSLARRPWAQRGFELMGRANGEIWFKVDSARAQGMRERNGTSMTADELRENLRSTATRCPTWLQTCVFALDGAPPSDEERRAYLELLDWAKREAIPLRGVFLYGPVRPSLREEASRISLLPREWVEGFAAEMRARGLEVRVTE